MARQVSNFSDIPPLSGKTVPGNPGGASDRLGSEAREANHQRAVRGRRLDTNLGPGTLLPGAGRTARSTDRPIYCGAIAGRAFGYVEHPNSKNPSATSVRFVGEFIGIKSIGEVLNTAEVYLPGSLTRTIKAALDIAKGHVPDPVPFSVEIWCEPDNREQSTIGYRYVCYDVAPQRGEAPLLALAYESGLIERPVAALSDAGQRGAREGETVDPETGEVS